MLTLVVLNVTQRSLHEALELVGMYVAEALLVKHAEGLLHALVGRPLLGSHRQVLVDDLLELRPRDDGVLVVVWAAEKGKDRQVGLAASQGNTHQQFHTTGNSRHTHTTGWSGEVDLTGEAACN